MVFTTSSLWTRIFPKKVPSPDRFWKRRKILKMAAHFRGRKQNCYTLALQHVMRSLHRSTYSRTLKKFDMREEQITRLKAACEEHGFKYEFMKESLIRSNILLNRKILCDLAIWEPRTFKCLTDFAWNKAKEEGLNGIDKLKDPPEGVILRPMLIK